jgi:hypothetical protein
LRPFVNLIKVALGVQEVYWEKEKKANLFYGSLESLRNLTKLKFLSIAGTDVDSGIEYLPESLVRRNKTFVGGTLMFVSSAPNCQEIRPRAKVKAIQDQLRPFNYDLEA